jgi:hypothetical protein
MSQDLTSGGLTFSPSDMYYSTGASTYPSTTDIVMDGTSDNPEKIAFVEKLIRTRKITLAEGLLLLQEKVTIRTQVVQAPSTYTPTPPYSSLNPYPYNNPPIYGGLVSGGAAQSTGLAFSSSSPTMNPPPDTILGGDIARDYTVFSRGFTNENLPDLTRQPSRDFGESIEDFERVQAPRHE